MVKTDIQIRFGDVDGVGHVNNAAIVEYYDLGLSDYFSHIGIINSPTLTGDIIAKVNININFFGSILQNDSIEVITKATKIGNRSLTFEQEIVDKHNKMVKSNCVTIMAGINKESLKSAEIDAKWKNLIKLHEIL